MTDYDLQRVEELFQAAADLPAPERDPYLAEACAGEDALRSHVETLLARLARDASFTAPAPGLAAIGHPPSSGRAAIAEGPGSIIDRYKLLQVIGEGGFGVVYMAEQQEPVVRKVALKIIKLGMDTREVVARFEAERQALAMMDHPNIARVLDGGATASGRPYFVMELVRGVSITDFADKNDLAPRERLELFEPVCHAVQHAHQKGVIHRDLKPSNVLVTLHDGRPMPKVIDFGVAKAMHTRLTEKTLFTKYEQFIGTPAYMSPEQAEMSALDVDTRTDIYSLGVLLYELLTGTTPFDTTSLLNAGLLEIQRIIREEQPPRPSMRISTAGDAGIARHRRLDVPGLSRVLRGDLDWIVMKALEKDRSRRYGTASEFADDIRRHLRNEPVVAGPPGATYRMRKFLARNRAGVVTATLVTLALVAGMISTSIQRFEADRNARLASQQAERASEQARRAVSTLDFLLSTLAMTNPDVAMNPNVTVRTLLDDTAARVSDAFADQPWAEARVRAAIGRAYTSLNELALAEPHLRRTVELVDELTAGGADLGAAGYGPGDFYTTLWTLTNVCFNLERADAFAVAQRRRQIGLDHVGESHPDLAEALRTFVTTVERNAWNTDPNAMEGVPALFKEAARRADAALEPGDALWPIVADSFLAAGYTVWYTPHEPLAQGFFERALAIQDRELPPESPEIANSVSLLAGVLNQVGKSEEAEALLRDSIESLRRVRGEDDFQLAMSESILGQTLVGQGRYAEAEPILRRAYDNVLKQVEDEAHWVALICGLRLIQLYDGWGQPDEARPLRATLAQVAARSAYPQQWRIVRLMFDAEHAELAERLARADAMCGGISYMASPGTTRAAELDPLALEIVEQREAVFTVDDPRSVTLARLFVGWANALDPEEHVETRRVLADAARTIFEGSGAGPPMDLAEARAVLASTARAVGADEEAEQHARAAWRILRDVPEGGMWFNTATDVRIARSLLEQGLYQEAESRLRPGYEVLVSQLGPDQPDTRHVRSLLFELYTRWGRPDEARLFGPDSPPDT